VGLYVGAAVDCCEALRGVLGVASRVGLDVGAAVDCYCCEALLGVTVARHFVGFWELLRVWDCMLELLLELLLTVTVARRFLGLLLRGTSWGTVSCFGDEKGSCDGPENDFDDGAENDFDEGPEVDNQLRRVSIRVGIINGL